MTTSTHQHTQPRQPDQPGVRSGRRTALIIATAASAVAALLGFLDLIRSGSLHPSKDGGGALLAEIAGSGVATTVHTVAALIGVAAGIAALAGALGRTGVMTVGVLQVAIFGLLLGSMGTLSTVGYLLAMAMPLLLLIVVVQVVRRDPVLRWVVGVPVLLAGAIGVALSWDTLGTVLANLGEGLAREATNLLLVLLLLVIGVAWAATAATAAAGSPVAIRATAWVLRHRTVITLVAAACALPYAVVRLTWLTPWPVLVMENVDMATRIWGLTLSSGAWLGFVLTIGLIRPWGEIFPRWMPWLAGKRVPIAAAAVPGGFIAAVMTFAAFPMIYSAVETDGTTLLLEFVLIFPCWLWGPALALAVWGYVAHRRGTESVS